MQGHSELARAFNGCPKRHFLAGLDSYLKSMDILNAHFTPNCHAFKRGTHAELIRFGLLQRVLALLIKTAAPGIDTCHRMADLSSGALIAKPERKQALGISQARGISLHKPVQATAFSGICRIPLQEPPQHRAVVSISEVVQPAFRVVSLALEGERVVLRGGGDDVVIILRDGQPP